MKHKNLNYNNGFMQASEGYDRDLRRYESLVIRQPLQRIEEAKKTIQRYTTARNIKITEFASNMARTEHIYKEKYKYWIEFSQTDTTGKIAAYLDNLKNERYVSKLYIAGFLTSQRITKLVEDNKEYLSRSHELYRTIWFDLRHYARITCLCNLRVSRIPFMKAFYAKLYDHYKIVTDSERYAMDYDFNFENISSIVPRLIGGEITLRESKNISLISTPILLNNISLQNLTSFTNGLETFLQMTRLNGHFFRYFITTDTLRFQRWRGHVVCPVWEMFYLIQWLLFLFVMYILVICLKIHMYTYYYFSNVCQYQSRRY